MVGFRAVLLSVGIVSARAWKVIHDDRGVRAQVDADTPEEHRALANYTEKVARENLAKIEGRRDHADSADGRRKLADASVEAVFFEMHNTQRADTAAGNTPSQPSASNMNQVFWDPALAMVAQNYADECHYEHNPDRSDDFVALKEFASYEVTLASKSVGENIFAHSSKTTSLEELAAWGMTAFFDEYADYTYSSGDCSGVCGHYTQIVWAETRYIGCGIAVCDSLTGIDEGDETYWTENGGVFGVCNYGKAGNNGAAPYEEGVPCTACQDDRQDVCADGSLCGGCMRYNFDACSNYYTSGCSLDWCGSDCEFGCENNANPCSSACYYCYDTCEVDGCSDTPATCCDSGLGDNVGSSCSDATTTTASGVAAGSAVVAVSASAAATAVALALCL